MFQVILDDIVAHASSCFFGVDRDNPIGSIFKEFKNGTYRIVAIYAKKARGLMCNYIIQNHLKRVEDIKSFNVEGYKFNKKISSEKEWLFTRSG